MSTSIRHTIGGTSTTAGNGDPAVNPAPYPKAVNASGAAAE